MEPLVRDADKLLPAILGPLRPTRHPLALSRFGLLAAALGGRARATRFDGPRGAGADRRATPRTRCCTLDARRRAAVALVLDAHRARGRAGRSRAAARRRSPTRSPRSLRSHGGGDRDRAPGRAHRRARRRAAPCCSTSRRARSSRSPATGCRTGTAARSSATATGPASSSSTGRSTARSRGRAPECRARRHRAPRRHARGDRRLGGAVATGGHPRALRAARPSRTRLRPEPRPGGQAHRLGVLPRAGRLDRGHDRRDRGPGRALRARLPRADPRARRDERRPRWRPTTPTTSAATSTAASMDLRQLFTRPVARPVPYTTPDERLFICSSSTPPGGGVHGMCGYFAAKAALRRG